VPDSSVLNNLLQNKRRDLDLLERQLPSIEQELATYTRHAAEQIPEMIIFDKHNALESVYADLKKTITTHNLITCKFFLSSTFSDQVTQNEVFSTHHYDFFSRAEQRKLLIDGYFAQGILTMDHLSHTQAKEKMMSFCPGIGTTHGYLCGSYLYIIQFKEFPTAFRLKSFDMSDLLHFVFEQSAK
jgi:hypothetical protein